MVKIRFGINTSFALRRYDRPKQWMELIYSTFELDLCELSLDLLDPTLREPTKTEYMQEMLELGDNYPIDIVSTRTGKTKYNDDLILHPNFGHRINSIQWFEQAIDVAAYTNSSFIGGYFGGLVIQNHLDPNQLEYVISFLIDSMSYLCSIAHAAGLYGIIFEPFSLVYDKNTNLELNKKVLGSLQERSKLSISITPVISMHGLDKWLEKIFEPIHVIQIHDIKEAKFVKSAVNALDVESAHNINVILDIKPSFELSEKIYLEQLKSNVKGIQDLFS